MTPAALADGAALVRSHPRHLLLGALVAGLLLGPLSPAIAFVAAVLLAAAVARPRLSLGVLVAVLAGALGARARQAALERTALHSLIGQTVDARALLLEPLRAGSSGWRSARGRLVTGRGQGEQVVLRIGPWVRWRGAPVGAELRLAGKLAALGPYDEYQRRRGAHAVLFVDSVKATGAVRGGAMGWIDRVRRRAQAGLSSGLPPPQAALARGMVLGQDEALSEPVRQDFRRSGLAHVLAASGQNVLLLAVLAMPLLAALGLGLRARLLGVLALIALYVPLAGAGPPIQRAGVMGAAGVIAGLAGRPASRWYALLLAAVVTLALNPRAVGDAGWQLSFAAVVSILVVAPLARAWLVRRRAPAPLAEAASLTFAATLGTAPLLAFDFGRLSIVSLPANLIAAPIVAPIMWLGMLSAALGQVAAGLAGPLNALNLYLLAFMQWLAHTAASLPAASVPLRIASPIVLAGAYAALAALVLVPRARAPGGLVAGLALVAALARPAAAAPGPPAHLTVSFLDVGQGDATLVQDHDRAILVDAGPPDGHVLARLAEAGVRRLDVVVVTHDQADHEGGMPGVLRRYPVGVVLDGADGATTREHAAVVTAAARAGVRRVAPDAGQLVHDGPLALHVLWPSREPAALHAGEDPNQRAIVAELTAGHFRALLPADAESDVTAALNLPRVDVLKVAHHGSADLGLADLLTHLRPSIAVIEVGRHNTYGHPTAQALGALRAVPHVYRTDLDGTVRVTVGDGGALQVQTSR